MDGVVVVGWAKKYKGWSKAVKAALKSWGNKTLCEVNSARLDCFFQKAFPLGRNLERSETAMRRSYAKLSILNTCTDTFSFQSAKEFDPYPSQGYFRPEALIIIIIIITVQPEEAHTGDEKKSPQSLRTWPSWFFRACRGRPPKFNEKNAVFHPSLWMLHAVNWIFFPARPWPASRFEPYTPGHSATALDHCFGTMSPADPTSNQACERKVFRSA